MHRIGRIPRTRTTARPGRRAPTMRRDGEGPRPTPRARRLARLVDGRLLDERGQRRAGALAQVREDPRPDVEHQREFAPDVAQEERLAGEIPERRLMGGQQRRQRPVGRLGLLGRIRRSALGATEDRELVRLRAGEPPEDGRTRGCLQDVASPSGDVPIARRAPTRPLRRTYSARGERIVRRDDQDTRVLGSASLDELVPARAVVRSGEPPSEPAPTSRMSPAGGRDGTPLTGVVAGELVLRDLDVVRRRVPDVRSFRSQQSKPDPATARQQSIMRDTEEVVVLDAVPLHVDVVDAQDQDADHRAAAPRSPMTPAPRDSASCCRARGCWR